MKKLTISEIARLCHAQIQPPSGQGEGQEDRHSLALITGLAALSEAEPHQATFLGDMRYRAGLEVTRAGCVLIGLDVECDRNDLTLLRCTDPSAAFTKVITAFAPAVPAVVSGVHPSAVVHPSAEVDPTCSIGPLCTVDVGAILKEGVVLDARSTVGAGCTVGAHTRMYPGVTLYPGVQIGERCILHAGVVIGSDGFGFEPTATGWDKIPQGGTVRLEDDVEVGANSTIDCARFGETLIGQGCKIDNLVHIAHNVRIGENSMLIAQSGVAGSTHLGRWVILAGQAGVGGHLKLHDGARLGAGSKALQDIPAGEVYFGHPAGPKGETLRALTFLPKLRAEFRKLKNRMNDLERGQVPMRTDLSDDSVSGVPRGGPSQKESAE